MLLAKKRIDETVTELVAPVVSKSKFELVDVEFVKEGAGWYLRIYIDKPGGITIDDCQSISEEVSKILDDADPIHQSYYLEVSSPGIDRPLKKDSEFERYKGNAVEVKLYEPIGGKKVFEGELQGLEGNNVVIRNESGDILRFERQKVSQVKRAIKF